MRSLPVALVLVGCTDPNGAFIPATESSSTSGKGTSTSAATTTDASTSTTSTSDPTTTSTSDPITSTSGPTTTLPVTSTSEATSTGSTSAGIECPEDMDPDHLCDLRHKDNDAIVLEPECLQLDAGTWAAKYAPLNGSIYFVPNQCPGAPALPFPIRLEMPAFNALGDLHGAGSCAIVTMLVEPSPGGCFLRVLTIGDLNGEFAWGEFGLLPALPTPLPIGWQKQELCGSEGLCDPAPQPGAYNFVVDGAVVPGEGEATPPGYHFWSLRAHVDGACINAPDPAAMIHFDYFLTKEP